MRIISGKYGGRIIKAPRGFKTHPMGDRVRSALFNMLGDLNDKTVWDAFSGSGAIAIEAASRGAEYVLATEKDTIAFKTIQANLEKLGAQEVQVVRANCKSWGKMNRDVSFDLIICDPPYNDLQLSTVFALKRYLKPKGLMVLSYPGRGQEKVPSANGVVVVDNRNYGDAAMAFYQLK